MKVDIHQLLPDLIPTTTMPIWECNFHSEELSKSGIYVFWDKRAFENPARKHFEYTDLPLYIGKAVKSKNSNSNYGIGKRMYDHYHKKDLFTKYAYFVDLYIFEDILDGKIDDPVKNMSYYYWSGRENKERRDSFPIDRVPISAFFKERCELSNDALTDIYEPYMISRRIPIFNKVNNHYAANNKTGDIERIEDYTVKNTSCFWGNWCFELEKESKKKFDKKIKPFLK